MAARMGTDARRAAILEATLVAAGQHGLARVTRDDVAAAAGVSAALVCLHVAAAWVRSSVPCAI